MHVHFAAAGTLECLSLRAGGLLRWYARCCNTPVANTLRQPWIAYASVVHSCLEGGQAAREATFGSRCVAVNTRSALGAVDESKAATLALMARVAFAVAAARLSGAWRHSPFMRDGAPVRVPVILADDARERAYSPQRPAGGAPELPPDR